MALFASSTTYAANNFIKADNAAKEFYENILLENTSSYPTAAHATNNGSISMQAGTSSIDITTKGDGQDAVVAEKGGKISLVGNVTTQGENAVAVYADQGQITITGNIKAEAEGSQAVYAGNNSLINITGNIISEGYWTEGLLSQDGSKIYVSGNVTTTNDKSSAVIVDNPWNGVGGTKSYVYVKGDIITYGNGNWSNGNKYHISSHGVLARLGMADIDGNVHTYGDYSSGLYAFRGGVINYLSTDRINTIKTEGSNAHAVYAWNGGTINLQSANISADATKNSYALLAEQNPNGLPSYINDPALIQGDGIFNISGAIASGKNGTIDMTMRSGSYFTGYSEIREGGTTNLNMNNSYWDMTKNSQVTHLMLDTNSTVDYSNSPQFSTLTVTDLDGAGLFKMKTDIVQQRADLLIVTGSTNGNHRLDVVNDGGQKTTGKELVPLVETADANGNFSLSHRVELGGYVYNLRQVDNTDPTNSAQKIWELYASPHSGNGSHLSSSANAAANFLNTGYLLTYIDNQTLFQRLGELRNTPAQEGEFWLRGFAGKLNSFSGNSLQGFDMNYNGVQLGIDKRFQLNSGNLYVGPMLGYTNATPNYRAGQGGVRNVNVGLYGTYIDDHGFYLDGVVKYLHLKNSFSVDDSQGQKVKGKGNSDGYSASLETGKRFKLATSHFYLEPQAQLTYSHQNGTNVHADNDLTVKLSSYDSILGRGSLVLGYQIKEGNNPVDLYLKSGYVREFKGDTAYYLNGSKENYRLKGGWVDSSLGISAQINQHHNLYSEIGYANGNRFDKQQINLGYRYNF